MREPEAEAPAPNSPTAPEPRREEPEEQDAPEDHDMPGQSGAEGPTAIPMDDEDETLELRNKAFQRGQKGKELDAKWFDDQECQVLREADRDHWAAHVKSGAIRVVPKGEVHKIGTARILPTPARFVRTHKDKGGGLTAESRMVVPGHLAPKGQVRTDAPTSPQFALYLLLLWLRFVRGWLARSLLFSITLLSRS